MLGVMNTTANFSVYEYSFQLVLTHECVFEIRSTDGSWDSRLGLVFDMEDGDFIAAAEFAKDRTRTASTAVAAATALLKDLI